jgi:hypothetical protein
MIVANVCLLCVTQLGTCKLIFIKFMWLFLSFFDLYALILKLKTERERYLDRYAMGCANQLRKVLKNATRNSNLKSFEYWMPINFRHKKKPSWKFWSNIYTHTHTHVYAAYIILIRQSPEMKHIFYSHSVLNRLKCSKGNFYLFKKWVKEYLAFWDFHLFH